MLEQFTYPSPKKSCSSWFLMKFTSDKGSQPKLVIEERDESKHQRCPGSVFQQTAGRLASLAAAAGCCCISGLPGKQDLLVS